MINLKSFVMFCPVLVLFLGAGSAFSADKAVESFKQQKCNECHSWTSQGIGKPEGEEGGAKAPPDLSALSKDVLGQADPKAFLHEFLLKKAEKNGKKHKKAFKGSDEELDGLIGLLLGQAKKK